MQHDRVGGKYQCQGRTATMTHRVCHESRNKRIQQPTRNKTLKGCNKWSRHLLEKLIGLQLLLCQQGVCILQKKIIRIITNTRPRDSCREVSQYIYSLVLYTIINKHQFDTNNEIHKYKTRNNNNLHRPIANLSKFNKGAYISGIKVFNHLPQ